MSWPRKLFPLYTLLGIDFCKFHQISSFDCICKNPFELSGIIPQIKLYEEQNWLNRCVHKINISSGNHVFKTVIQCLDICDEFFKLSACIIKLFIAMIFNTFKYKFTNFFQRKLQKLIKFQNIIPLKNKDKLKAKLIKLV